MQVVVGLENRLHSTRSFLLLVIIKTSKSENLKILELFYQRVRTYNMKIFVCTALFLLSAVVLAEAGMEY